MANFALLTAVGPDRPGIVAGVSEVLFRADCNIEDSKMARLGGTFACMLVLRLPDGLTSDQLIDHLAAARQELDLWLRLTDLQPAEAIEPTPDQPCHVIEVRGADRPGIVHQLSAHLASRSVNITNLATRVQKDHPPQYVMHLEVEVPNFVDLIRLKAELIEIGRAIDVEVSLQSADEAAGLAHRP